MVAVFQFKTAVDDGGSETDGGDCGEAPAQEHVHSRTAPNITICTFRNVELIHAPKHNQNGSQ